MYFGEITRMESKTFILSFKYIDRDKEVKVADYMIKRTMEDYK